MNLSMCSLRLTYRQGRGDIIAPMTEDSWTDSDDLAFRLSARDERHPAWVAQVFCALVIAEDDESATRLMTPGSRGDLPAELRRVLSTIPSPALGQEATPAAPDAPDIAVVRIHALESEVRTVSAAEEALIAARIALVWDPDAGSWLVDSLFEGPLTPDFTGIERPSPGWAPPY